MSALTDSPSTAAPGHSPEQAGVTGARISIASPALGAIGALAALLTGGWLMYAPFLLGYQPGDAAWKDPTKSDFFTGLGLAILAVIALAFLVAGLVGALRARGVLSPRRRAAQVVEASPAPAAAPGTELAELLRPLVEALNRDIATQPNGRPAAAEQRTITDPAGH